MVFGTSEIALEDPNDGTYGVRVDLDEDAEVGSIEFALQGNEIKEFENISVTDNSPPFSLYVENDDGLLGAALPYGWVFILMATAYSEDDGGGEPLQIERATLEVSNYPASPANSPATGAPTISGTGQVGQTLTASTSGISDADGLTNVSYSYQWLADDAEISGATGGSYTLTDSEEGKAIKVKVSFTDDAGNEETLTQPAARPGPALWPDRRCLGPHDCPDLEPPCGLPLAVRLPDSAQPPRAWRGRAPGARRHWDRGDHLYRYGRRAWSAVRVQGEGG